jgi:hypothetical protein
MASSTSLGWGVGLQSGDRKDYLGQMADNITKMGAARAKAAEKSAKAEEKIVNEALEKLEVPSGNQFVPMYLNKINEVAKQGIDEIVKMKQAGASASDIYIKASEYERQLASLNNANTVAWQIWDTKDYMVPESFRTVLMNPNSKPEDLEAFNNDFFGMRVDPKTYYISFAKIPKDIKTPELKHDLIDVPTGKTEKAGNVTKEEVMSSVKPESISAAAASMMADVPTAQQLIFMAIYDNPIDVVKKLKVNEGESMKQYLERNKQESAADPSIPNIEERALAIAEEKVKAKAQNPQLKWQNRPQPRASRGNNSKTKLKEVPAITDLTTETGDQIKTSDWDKVSSIQITVTAQNRSAIEKSNPSLNGLLTDGDVLTFYPNTAEGRYTTGSLIVNGEWDLSDDKVKLIKRGREVQQTPNANGQINYVYAESAFRNSLGGGAAAEIASYKWYAKMLNKSLDINDYDQQEQDRVREWMKKNKSNDSEAGVAAMIRYSKID